jgi:DNA repair photolyase
VAPILPGITDSIEHIQELARAVRACGGRFAHPTPLRLYPALHRGFLPVIERHYPDLATKYRRAYRGAGNAPKSYTDVLVKRFRRIAREFGVAVSDPVLDRSSRGSERHPDHGAGSDESQLGFWEAGRIQGASSPSLRVRAR